MKPYLTIHFAKGQSCVTWGLAITDAEFEQMFQLRYRVYRKKGLMKYLDGDRDQDYLDHKGCHHFIACYEGRVVGSARMIYAPPLPTESVYFDIDLPTAVTSNEPGEKFEIGRLTADLSTLPVPIPRHLVLLGNLYAMLRFAQEQQYTLALGTVKHYVRKKFEKIGLPITYMAYRAVKYDPKTSDDPLDTFFDLQKTGLVHPLYISLASYSKYIDSLLNNPLCFKQLPTGAYNLHNAQLFNLILLYRGFKHKSANLIKS